MAPHRWFSVVALVLAAGAASASAQESGTGQPTQAERTPERYLTARELFTSGLAAAERRQWQDAAELFRQSLALVERPNTLFNLALVQVELGNYVGAFDTLDRHARLVGGSSGEAEADDLQVKTVRDQVRARVAKLSIQVKPADAQLRLDGGELRAVTELPTVVEPGKHVLRAEAPGYRPQTKGLLARPGAAVIANFSLEAVPHPPSTRRADTRAESPAEPAQQQDGTAFEQPWFWIASGGVAAATAVVMAIALGGGGGNDPTVYMGTSGVSL